MIRRDGTEAKQLNYGHNKNGETEKTEKQRDHTPLKGSGEPGTRKGKQGNIWLRLASDEGVEEFTTKINDILGYTKS